MASPRSFPLRMLAVATLGAAAMTAHAAGVVERVTQRGVLVAGVPYVVPPYNAGAKFRTPEGMETALAEDLAARLKAKLTTVRAEPAAAEPVLAAGKADVLLAAVADGDPLHKSAAVVPTGYSFGPMAIMRTDTDIKTWQQLKGRKVCVAEGGMYTGMTAARYGAVEKVYKAPADSLLALRVGDCDAAVHDSTLLEELVKMPEWKKFSARLPVGPRTSLVFAVPQGDAKTVELLRKVTGEWQARRHLEQLTNKRARHIAFEVYLDQDVPDCH